MFKLGSRFAIGKSNRCLDSPWPEFGCVRNFSGIVFLKPGTKVFSASGVKVFSGRFTLKNVNVVKLHL